MLVSRPCAFPGCFLWCSLSVGVVVLVCASWLCLCVIVCDLILLLFAPLPCGESERLLIYRKKFKLILFEIDQNIFLNCYLHN